MKNFSIKKYGFGLCVLCLSAGNLHAKAVGLPFLSLGVGAHAQAMGGAYVARVQDASAVYWNPSALAGIGSREVFLYHSNSASDLQYDYVSYVQPLKGSHSSLGFAFGNLSKGTYSGRNEDRAPTGEFGAADRAVSAAYGRKINEKVSVGGGVKMIQSNIGSYSSTGFAMDVAASYQASQTTRLSAGVYHLGPSMQFVDESFNMPANIAAGVSRQFFRFFSITADSRYGIYDQKLSFSLGGELNFADFASFRMGYLSNLSGSNTKADAASAMEKFTGAGMGVGLKLFSRASLDYAFIPMGELGGTHHMDLTLRFK